MIQRKVASKEQSLALLPLGYKREKLTFIRHTYLAEASLQPFKAT
jgi:hypothetical protein